MPDPSNRMLLCSWLSRLALVLTATLVLSSCLSSGIPQLGDQAPGFSVKSIQGDSLQFDPQSGRVHLLYFWADWCARCEDDFRLMDRLYAQWKKDPVSPVFLAINVGQTEEHVHNFLKRMKTSFPVYMDADGAIARSFGVKGLPTYFMIDGKGVVCHIILGWADEKLLLEEIRKTGKMEGSVKQ